MTGPNECLLLGVGSPYVYEVYESLARDGWTVRAFLDNQDKGEGPSDLGVVVNFSDAQDAWRALPVMIPLLTPGIRKAVRGQAEANRFSDFMSHIDPSAVIASTAAFGAGVLVNAGAAIGAKTRLEPFVIVNRSVSVGHHVVIEEYATLGPGSILCGSTLIGRGAFIGAGAVVNPKIKIGANAIVGAGAVVVNDVEPSTIVVGNPAKPIKSGIKGYGDIGV